MSKRRVGGVIKKAIEKEEKEPVKVAPKKKVGKAQIQQEQIMLNIENTNTTQHIQELCDKFEPPDCKKCPNRSADRICVNNDCGHHNYLELICGKCHLTQHSVCKEKPELDVEEFFIKLGTFLNESKFNTSFQEQGINIEKLQETFAQIDRYNRKLDEIESVIKREIMTYKTPEETENSITNSITKALSEPTFENIQEELDEIKTSVLFEDNKFRWNGIQEKAKYLRDQVKIIREENKDLRQTINSSFVGGRTLDLNEISVEDGILQYHNKKPKWTHKNSTIVITTVAKTYQQQVYLDFSFDPLKKYTLRFTLTQYNNQQFFVGLMKKEQTKTAHIYGGQSSWLFKRFMSNSPTQDCSKVLRGSDFGNTARTGDSFEMRFSISDQILEFSSYPDQENILSKLDHASFEQNADYVIAFSIYNNVTLTIDSLEESFFFPTF